MGKATKDKRDIYYRKAKEEGWRARSAFKLLQIDEVSDLFTGVKHAVDLCAAPGSWSQVLSRKLYLPAVRAHAAEVPRLVAIDLQPMAPVEGVTQLQGDITRASVAAQVVACLGGCPADLVVCDGAPDVTGLHDLDEYIQSQLIVAALTIVMSVLRPGGTFVAKIFRGKEAGLLYSQLKVLFAEVSCAKPKSSRNSSVEAFVVCRGFTPPHPAAPRTLPRLLQGGGDVAAWDCAEVPEEVRRLAPFIACGDINGWDADANYDLDVDDNDGADDGTGTVLTKQPVQPPTMPAYRTALELAGRAPALAHQAMPGPAAGTAVEHALQPAVTHLQR